MTCSSYFRVIISTTCFTLVCCECLIKPKTDYKDALLKRISNFDDLHTEYEGFTYHVSICPKTSASSTLAGATKRKIPLNQTTTVIGRYNDSDIVGKDDWVLLTYGSGDKISNDSKCNGASWKTLIFIKCDPKSDEVLEVLEPLSSACMAIFLIRTTLLCPEETGWSGLSVFFTLFCVFLTAYFLVMIAYRRFILGAKGYEQVPHYHFIQSVLSLPMAFIRKVLAGNSSPRTPPSQPINPDPADEPLLSP